MLACRARYVFPIDSPPIGDGVVAWEDNRIVAVGSRSSAAMNDFAVKATDLGDVAILPGLINPHTHLEFSDIEKPLGAPGMAFPDWIRHIVNHRRGQAGDFVRRGDCERLAGVYGQLRYGVRGNRVGPILQEHRSQFGNHSVHRSARPFPRKSYRQAGGCILQRSPNLNRQQHFGPELVHTHPIRSIPNCCAGCVRLSAERRIPLAFHLAESREELKLLKNGSGPFLHLLRDLASLGT